jgi:hypothetical protein
MSTEHAWVVRRIARPAPAGTSLRLLTVGVRYGSSARLAPTGAGRPSFPKNPVVLGIAGKVDALRLSTLPSYEEPEHLRAQAALYFVLIVSRASLSVGPAGPDDPRGRSVVRLCRLVFRVKRAGDVTHAQVTAGVCPT